MISIATKSTLIIKNTVHLAIAIKFHVSFKRNKSFYEKSLTLTFFFSKIGKRYTFSILSTVFAQITNLKM